MFADLLRRLLPGARASRAALLGASLAAAAAPALAAETTTPSGLRVSETAVGTGAEAKPGKAVSVHYTGWLYKDGAKGAKFDSSVDRDEPFTFRLGAGEVIPGWDEGVSGMKVGGKRPLVIPPQLAYGARGAGGVSPPNATLLFDVELLGVK